MFEIQQSASSRNDYMFKTSPLPAHFDLDAVTREKIIRAGLRDQVRGELKYTTRGNRGLGKTRPDILERVRNARRNHTASIERTAFWQGRV